MFVILMTVVLKLCLFSFDTLVFFNFRPKNVLVYNCTTGGINPFHWGEVGMASLSFLNTVSVKALQSGSLGVQ